MVALPAIARHRSADKGSGFLLTISAATQHGASAFRRSVAS